VGGGCLRSVSLRSVVAVTSSAAIAVTCSWFQGVRSALARVAVKRRATIDKREAKIRVFSRVGDRVIAVLSSSSGGARSGVL
jgi:hypothetical protein